jgi:hypothetical protein
MTRDRELERGSLLDDQIEDVGCRRLDQCRLTSLG